MSLFQRHTLAENVPALDNVDQRSEYICTLCSLKLIFAVL